MNILVIIIAFCLLLLVLYVNKPDITLDPVKYTHSLTENGFLVVKKAFTPGEISFMKTNDFKRVKSELLKSGKLNTIIQTQIGPGYTLQDYIWVIKKSSVHTCHRDNNGDIFNKNQKHPSYTMLIYLEDMEKCLGVIDKSHNKKISILDDVKNIICDKGDLIIFNANLIHTGTFNNKDDNLRIQMKITHKDDLETLGYYQDFNKVLDKPNTVPVYLRKIQNKLSCALPMVSDLTQNTNIDSARGSDNGAKIGFLQRMFSYVFYGNEKFYDLPNAF